MKLPGALHQRGQAGQDTHWKRVNDRGSAPRNKRLLFVQSGSDEREDLERSLGSMARVWDVAFAGSAAEALEWMARQPADAIVTDLRLPDQSGADLLNQIGERYPQTLRFIRASFADRGLILACVWGTHQFIPKPCDGAELVTRLSRAMAITNWLADDGLKARLSRMGNLPSLPSLYFEVMKLLESPAASVEALAEVVSRDLALTAKLLQLVNSAFFGFAQRITSVRDALTILGLETVKSIVLGVHAFSHYETAKLGQFSVDRLWGHSVAVATAAKRITLAHTHDEQMADEAFTAGLLHDIGKLALAANFPEDYGELMRRVAEQPLHLPDLEREHLGATHGEAGGYLLGLWGMPVSMIETAVHHHRPGECAHSEFAPLTAVHLANVIDREQHPDPNEGVPPALDVQYFDALGLADRMDAWRSGDFTPLGNVAISARPEHSPSKDAARHLNPGPSHPVARRGVEAKPGRRVSSVVASALAICVLVVAVVVWWSVLEQRRRPPEVHARTLPMGALVRPAGSGAPTGPSEEGDPAWVASPGAIASTLPVFAVEPSVQVGEILFDWLDPAAIINGQLVRLGEVVGGAEVVDITPDVVTVRMAGRSLVLRLPQ
ncbi:MAG TPA: response regulator [Methylomirabilota bacterium]|nr:response regulator [Methylomirabilota bacterium]